MKELTKDKQEKAKQYIFKNARPLEKAIYRYYFEEGTQEAVFNELAAFQNPDGGFGQAMEPDLRVPESSALATAVALDMLRELNAPAELEPVKHAIAYVLKTYDREKHVWRIIPETTDSSPHAPWWNQDGLEDTFGHFLSNPRPELVGFLWTYGTLVPADFREQILQTVLACLESLPDTISGDALLSYLRLYDTDNLPHEPRSRLEAKLLRVVPASIETDSAKWSSYCITPLMAITSPDSPFAQTIPEAIEKNLDYAIDTQCADGSWKPHWAWGDAYPDAWQTAEREWRGILTLRTLRTLRNFSRLQ